MVEIIRDGMGQVISAAFSDVDEILGSALTAQALSLDHDLVRDTVLRWHTECTKLSESRTALEEAQQRNLDAQRLAQLQAIQGG